MMREVGNVKSSTIILISILWIHKASAQSNVTSDYPELQPDWSYCFAFTWFGPDYDNVTNRYNNTCADYFEETRAEGVPCTPPIVITYNGTPPDMAYLWDNHKASILCRRSSNQRCMKYTYFLNNHVTNITYSCVKVHYQDGGDIDYGCFNQKLDGGYKTEACICESTTGIYPPCNRGSFIESLSYSLLAAILLVSFSNLFQSRRA
ncbi:unnamed protein product [Phaedon cochleariae]|uniref:Uncharacterized protein n=1 Tax=Phaedon cochleariae TaxID=80249 RepID=A0A9P0DIZ0_PHACE|nr:unnamed protein product [Phaedon cochleariae]